jgi:hypothetical protein
MAAGSSSRIRIRFPEYRRAHGIWSHGARLHANRPVPFQQRCVARFVCSGRRRVVSSRATAGPFNSQPERQCRPPGSGRASRSGSRPGARLLPPTSAVGRGCREKSSSCRPPARGWWRASTRSVVVQVSWWLLLFGGGGALRDCGWRRSAAIRRARRRGHGAGSGRSCGCVWCGRRRARRSVCAAGR